MTARVYRFHPAAEREMIAAGDLYDERVPGLGDEFFDAVEHGIAQILDRPHAWQRYEVRSSRLTRRYALERFPFLIVYDVNGDIVRIIAVAHAKKRPGYWQGRIDE